MPTTPFGVAILRRVEPSRAEALADRCLEAGIDFIEVTMQGPQPAQIIERLAKSHPRATIGAGTVLTARHVQDSRIAGAQFLFAPNFSEAVSEAAAREDLLYIPGVATPGESANAFERGWRVQKVFPASLLTPAWISAVSAPLPEVKFIATGGVDASNAAQFLAAGAVGLGFGSCLEDPGQLRELSSIIRAHQTPATG